MKLNSFTKANRLKKPKDFNKIYKKGEKFFSGYFVLFFLSGEGLRLGINVTKKVGSAPKRSRLKRISRECFRLKKETLPEGSYVVKARLGSAAASNKNLRKDLTSCFNKLLGD